MPTIELTETRIEKLRAPDPSGRQVLHWDAKVRGLGVLCSGKTTSKTFVAQHKLKDGRTRRVTVGPVAMGLKKARAEAAAIVAGILKGGDPKAERRAEAARGRTLREALDGYLEYNRDIGERSRRGYRSGIEGYLAAWLDAPIRDVTPESVLRRHAAIAAEVTRRDKGARRGGGPTTGEATADGAMRALRAVWYHQAEIDPSMPPNPVRMRKGWFKVPARKRSVTPERLPEFYQAVCGLPSRAWCDYILLLLFTGMRRGEAAALRWAEVDLAGRAIRLPADRTKTKRPLDLPMSSFVRDLLVARRALGSEPGGWVFGSSSRSGHLEEPKGALGEIAKATAKAAALAAGEKVGKAGPTAEQIARFGVAVSAHDLRRTFTTVANGTVSGRDARALVNHAVGGSIHSDYDMVSTEELRPAAQRVCDRLMELCGIAPAEGVARIAAG